MLRGFVASLHINKRLKYMLNFLGLLDLLINKRFKYMLSFLGLLDLSAKGVCCLHALL